MSTWIKFCGTTCLEDALASIEAGANALGFIFAPSKRQVTIAQAKEIVSKLPDEVERIGVFLSAGSDEIRKVLDEVDLTGIQLHDGQNTSRVYDSLPAAQRKSLRTIRTILVNNGFAARLDEAMNEKDAGDSWLLDSGAGSGKTFDWSTARTTLGERKARFIIAGGLTPENVGQAIGIFSPFGVDVVSGIESTPGRKDPEKMKAFVAAVRKAEQR
jgi:phosphoribosylanthranilate isomerase